jgi:hypothetical protein
LIEPNAECDVRAFLIDHINDVQAAWALAHGVLIIAAHHRAQLVLLPLSLFSRAMECRSRVLWEVIPTAREMLREWFEIDEYFGDSAEIRNCSNVVSVHFLAHKKHNAFYRYVIVTAFAFSPFDWSEIRATEQDFQTQGEIVSIGEPPFGSEMQQEFQRVLGLQETPHTEDSDLHQFLLHSGAQDIDDKDLQDPIDPELISDAPLPPDPDGDSFQTILQDEFALARVQRMGRNRMAGILGRSECPSIIKAVTSGMSQTQSFISSSLVTHSDEYCCRLMTFGMW